MWTQCLSTPLTSLLAAIGFVVAALSALGQAPVISWFSQNGQLVWTNLQPGSTASVEWAPSAQGPWTNNWAGLDAVTVNSNGVIQMGVSMFYRVHGAAAPPFPAPSNMVWILAGTFTMGSPTNEPARGIMEGPQTQVTISRGFFMGQFEVTQSEYLSLIGINPSLFQGPLYGTNLSRPVENMSWEAATNYCAASF